jgi:hypothetical protein
MIGWLKWKIAWWRWFLNGPTVADLRYLRQTGHYRRNTNYEILNERWEKSEPKRENY